MNPIAITDALLARIGRHVAAIQITRFQKTTASGVLLSVAELFVDTSPSTEATDEAVPALKIMLTSHHGQIVDQCEIAPVSDHVELVLFDRCLRAAWHWRLPLALNKERQRLESWDPRYPLAVDPTALQVPWARDVLGKAGYEVKTEGERLTITQDKTTAPHSIDAAFHARGVMMAGIKEAGFSLSALKAIREAHAEGKKGVRTTAGITFDRTELRWWSESRFVSEAIASREPAHREGGAVATRDIAVLGFEGWDSLRAFGWGGNYREVTLWRPKEELRAIKHLLCAHAAGVRA